MRDGCVQKGIGHAAAENGSARAEYSSTLTCFVINLGERFQEFVKRVIVSVPISVLLRRQQIVTSQMRSPSAHSRMQPCPHPEFLFRCLTTGIPCLEWTILVNLVGIHYQNTLYNRPLFRALSVMSPHSILGLYYTIAKGIDAIVNSDNAIRGGDDTMVAQ